MVDSAAVALVIATVKHAKRDWSRLCRGRRETANCNFKELERFFTVECGDYIAPFNIDHSWLWEELCRERREKLKKKR